MPGLETRNLPRAKSASELAVFLVLLVSLITSLAYLPVLFDFFSGDDFVHLVWLKDAIADPRLILQNFYCNWLEVPTTRFYRPLISVFMVSDYLVWGGNGLGFHLSNLIFHLLSTVSVFFIAAKLETLLADQDKNHQSAWQKNLYGFFAAATFGLYPLHPEAVCWITGRVDTVVTAFFSFSFLLYLKYRQSGNRFFVIASLTMMALSLASKEMAVVLPILLVSFELLHPDSKSKNVLSRLLATLPFWLLLLAYFLLRRLALGTFVGGYDNSLQIGDWGHYLNTWLHGLRMFALPLNRNLVATSDPLTYMFSAASLIMLLAVITNLLASRKLSRLFLFNFSFVFLAFLPVYKVFAIANDLQGSRLAYLSSAGLSLIIAMAVIDVGCPKLQSLKRIACASYLLLCFCALWLNNQAWRLAGLESNAIRASLNSLYKKVKGDPQVLITGLPDNIDGAYVCRNALNGMTKFPQLERDIYNCLTISSVEPIVPFGFLRDSLVRAGDKVLIFNWNEKQKKLVAVKLEDWLNSENNAQENTENNAPRLSIKQSSGSPKDGIELESANITCFALNFVAIDLVLLPGLKQPVRADLFFKNENYPDVKQDSENKRAAHAVLSNKPGRKRLIFSLRAIPEFALGGKLKGLLFKAPAMNLIKVKGVEILEADDLIAGIDFENSGYLGSKGFLHLSSKSPAGIIKFDGSKVACGDSCLIEINRPNKMFQALNCQSLEPGAFQTLPVDLRGQLSLKKKNFPTQGFYLVRVRCLDSKKEPVGLAGDHIVVAVDD